MQEYENSGHIQLVAQNSLDISQFKKYFLPILRSSETVEHQYEIEHYVRCFMQNFDW